MPCLKTPKARCSCGAEPVAVLAQEPGQSLGGLPADIEHGGVGDAGQRVKPLAVRNLIFADCSYWGFTHI
jgi:hypothetical protein